MLPIASDFLLEGLTACRAIAGFDALQRHLWTFIPYVPLGQFDVDNAWRQNITGVPEGAFNAYWNIEKH